MRSGYAALRPALEVRVYGTRVGELGRDIHGAVHFTPDAEWLEKGQHPPLGLAFLINPRVRTARTGIPSWFDNLLPEIDNPLRCWLCNRLGIREADSAALLAALGRDLPGAVEIVGEIDGEHERISEPSPTPLEPRQLRFSLAGVQLKLSMVYEDGRYALPASGESGRWIVKIPGERFPDLPEVEAATMTWARSSGLDVPAHQILPIASVQGVDPRLLGRPTSAFAVQRFDRRVDGRVHQEDFAQALEIPPADKYQDSRTRRIGYDGLLRLVGDTCGPRAREEFLTRIAFVVGSGNGDAHLKNWSLQWDHDHRPRLSPCYDLVATIAWQDLEPTLALALGGIRPFAQLDRAALRRLAERSHFPEAESVFMAALERIHAAWPLAAGDAPPRMRDALTRHWAGVPILASFGGL